MIFFAGSFFYPKYSKKAVLPNVTRELQSSYKDTLKSYIYIDAVNYFSTS